MKPPRRTLSDLSEHEQNDLSATVASIVLVLAGFTFSSGSRVESHVEVGGKPVTNTVTHWGFALTGMTCLVLGTGVGYQVWNRESQKQAASQPPVIERPEVTRRGHSSYFSRNFGLIALKLNRPPIVSSYSSTPGRKTTPSRWTLGFSALVPSA